MGYATKRVKRRKHAYLMKLHACCALAGYTFLTPLEPRRVHALQPGETTGFFRYTPGYKRYHSGLGSAVRYVAKRLGVR
jgi:hypothetical protein